MAGEPTQQDAAWAPCEQEVGDRPDMRGSPGSEERVAGGGRYGLGHINGPAGR